MSREKPKTEHLEGETQRLSEDEIIKLKEEFGVEEADSTVFFKHTGEDGKEREHHFSKILGLSRLREKITRVRKELGL